MGETGKDKFVWKHKQLKEAGKLAARFDKLGEGEIVRAVVAAQEKGECPQSLENFGALDATGRKAALDSLGASAKARIYSRMPVAKGEDCAPPTA